jgi:hypothetical protein
MARGSRNDSINDVINRSVRVVVAGLLPKIQRLFDAAVEARIQAELPKAKQRRGGRSAPSRRAGEITRWVADNRARRVPNFVIEATGLDTKKKIVAKYGANAAFGKGKPLPPVKLPANTANAKDGLPREVKAKPPVIRKAAAAK